jgi:hypothetical protein
LRSNAPVVAALPVGRAARIGAKFKRLIEVFCPATVVETAPTTDVNVRAFYRLAQISSAYREFDSQSGIANPLDRLAAVNAAHSACEKEAYRGYTEEPDTALP